ncbi:MAG TPA: PAS domain S-box protein [Salinimicrobium sp.]|nr:PAS domain S-box protein [Salinimicrobium sp.]
MEKNPFQNIYQALPFPCLILRSESSGEFTVTEANEAFYQVTSAKESEIKGRELSAIFENPPVYLKRSISTINNSLRKVVRKRKRDTIKQLRYDILSDRESLTNRYWKVDNVPILDSDDKVSHILCTVYDITSQVLTQQEVNRYQAELIRNQQQYRDFLEQNLEGLFSLDLEGKFISVNQAQADLAELSPQELIDMNFLPFCSPRDKERIAGYFKKAIDGEVSNFKASFISAKGREMTLEISLVPMKNDQTIVGAYGAAKLINKQKREKVVVEKKKLLQLHADFINSLLKNRLDPLILSEAFENIGGTIGVDRMYLFTTDKSKETQEVTISQKVEWVGEKATPQIDNPDLQKMPVKRLEEIMGPLTKNLPFTAVLSELPEGELKEIFLDEDIKSMLLFPIFLRENLFGFIGFDDCTSERIWNEDEILFLQTLSGNLANNIEKHQAELKAQEKTRELILSEKKFKALIQEGSDLMTILDSDGNYTFVSDTVYGILGTRPEDLIGKKAFDFIHHEDLDRILEDFERLKKERQIKVGPFRYRDSAGKWRWLETTATNMLGDSAVNGVICNSRDISTILKQAREIENINERYRLAATATNDLIYDWDLENEYVHRFHRSLSNLFGYSINDLEKKDFWNINIHPDDFPRESRKLKEALANSEKNFIHTEYRFKRADGTYANVIDRGYIIRDTGGKAIRLVGATSDISELTTKEEALKAANRQYKFAMKATNEIIWDWDIISDKVSRSNAFHKILGYEATKETTDNSFWRTIINPGDVERVLKSLETALGDTGQEKWQEEYKIFRASGETAYILDRGFIIRDQNGKPKQMVGAVLDVTQSRKMLKEIRKQNKVLKEIAWEQSHLVRAPLARLKGLMELLEEKNFGKMSYEEILFHMDSSVDELDNIIRSIVQRTEKIKDGSSVNTVRQEK